MVERYAEKYIPDEDMTYVEPDPGGPWVRYSDYQAMEDRCAELVGILRDIKDTHGVECIPDTDIQNRIKAALAGKEGE